MKKVKKFITKPGIFFRDYLNKKYPIKNIEQPYTEPSEPIIIQSEYLLNDITAMNTIDIMPIDVVFTWVDNSDLEWSMKYYKYVPIYSKSSALYATDSARFTNHNELYYSVHAVLEFLPWVKHIYIVTDNQKPHWLSEEYKNKITIVDHKTIIDEKYLPTFNSHVIEAFLHKIPNLNENFIYFNDDVFVARALQPEHFFQNNGIASIFISEKSLIKMREKGTITPTLSASERSIKLLNKYYKTSIDKPLVHTYIPLKKSMYQLAWYRYKDEINEFLLNKFRKDNDLNFANFLIPWLMFFEGKAVPKIDICYYFNIRSPNAITIYRKLLNNKEQGILPHSFCANDFHSNKSIQDYKNKLAEMLKKYYGKE